MKNLTSKISQSVIWSTKHKEISNRYKYVRSYSLHIFCNYCIHSVNPPPYLEEGWDFWKFIEGVGSRFSYNNKGVRIYREFFYRRGGEHYFSFIMYKICRSNALYAASLIFRMFSFILIPFNTWDFYYFSSNLSVMLLINVLLIKNYLTEFSFVFTCYFIEVKLSQRVLSKTGYSEKRGKSYRGLSITGSSSLLHTMVL